MWSVLTGLVRLFYFAKDQVITWRKAIASVFVSVWCGMLTYNWVKSFADENMVGVYVSIAALIGEWVFSYLSENYTQIFDRIVNRFFRNGNQDTK